MKSRIVMLTVTALFAALVSKPAHLHSQEASPPPDHALHHPEATVAPETKPALPLQTNDSQSGMMAMMSRMTPSDAKLDELVKKMNAATGSAKTDAMAELLTALVNDRGKCQSMMTNMMSMMNMMGGMSSRGMGGMAPTTPAK